MGIGTRCVNGSYSELQHIMCLFQLIIVRAAAGLRPTDGVLRRAGYRFVSCLGSKNVFPGPAIIIKILSRRTYVSKDIYNLCKNSTKWLFYFAHSSQ